MLQWMVRFSYIDKRIVNSSQEKKSTRKEFEMELATQHGKTT